MADRQEPGHLPGSRDGTGLPPPERKEILLDNIFGVDIDPQAVEVTKLSLLLKVLEGENQETIGSQCRSCRNGCCPTWAGTSSAATR